MPPKTAPDPAPAAALNDNTRTLAPSLLSALGAMKEMESFVTLHGPVQGRDPSRAIVLKIQTTEDGKRTGWLDVYSREDGYCANVAADGMGYKTCWEPA